MGAIEALETYHLRVLKIMAQERLTSPDDPDSIVLTDRSTPETVRYWSVRDFASVDPDLAPDVVESLIVACQVDRTDGGPRGHHV